MPRSPISFRSLFLASTHARWYFWWYLHRQNSANVPQQGDSRNFSIPALHQTLFNRFQRFPTKPRQPALSGVFVCYGLQGFISDCNPLQGVVWHVAKIHNTKPGERLQKQYGGGLLLVTPTSSEQCIFKHRFAGKLRVPRRMRYQAPDE
ncbi:hypothetical protein QF002_006429 [Paraburkholderia youngii]